MGKTKGLFTHVYESAEALDEAVKNTAEHLCTYNMEAMVEMKNDILRREQTIGMSYWLNELKQVEDLCFQILQKKN